MSRLKSLGWQSCIDLDEGLSKTVDLFVDKLHSARL